LARPSGNAKRRIFSRSLRIGGSSISSRGGGGGGGGEGGLGGGGGGDEHEISIEEEKNSGTSPLCYYTGGLVVLRRLSLKKRGMTGSSSGRGGGKRFLNGANSPTFTRLREKERRSQQCPAGDQGKAPLPGTRGESCVHEDYIISSLGKKDRKKRALGGEKRVRLLVRAA